MQPKPAAPAQRNPTPESAPPAAPASPAAAPALPPLPTVRRNGYDKVAVDRALRQLPATMPSSDQRATRAESRVGQLEAELAQLRTQLEETSNPSYAGLGGRASAMLRLAEEEAAEMRAVAQRDADEIRGQATRDAQAIRPTPSARPTTCASCRPRSSTTTRTR